MATPPETPRGYGFGTFKGVFTPSLLTILGVIMYLRFGWVLGNVGLALTLVIVTLSTAITFLTGLSISALATNMRVGGGGAYFMISRYLGVEMGAAVGLPLYFAQALSIAFYIAGFAESVQALVPDLPLIGFGVITLLVLTAMALRSADFALKSQFFILALIGASLLAFFTGGPPTLPAPEEVPPAVDFWPVFAVFFPAVTGILAGVALSGDLKDPTRSLPLGTMGAIAAGYVVYMTIPVFLHRMVPDDGLLRAYPLIMENVASVGSLIYAGIWGATLSSALGSLLGAPRTLQALARDGIIPRAIGRGFGDNDEPLIAAAITVAVALIGVVAGDLNIIAPVLTMFFLTAYGLLNLSSGLAGLIGSASWRPRFNVHWGWSIGGFVGCLATMVMINAGATIVAIVVCAAVYWIMQRRSLKAHWDDMRYGIFMLAAQHAIYQLDSRRPDEQNWRPNILVLGGAPRSRWYLIELADALARGRGFLTVATILPRSEPEQRVRKVSETVREYLRRRDVRAMVVVHIADAPLKGSAELVSAYGFGPLAPNTVLLGVTARKENFVDYAQLVISAYRRHRNIVLMRRPDADAAAEQTLERSPRIDVWWGGEQNNASLMLALGYLLRNSPEWSNARLVLRSIVPSEPEQEPQRNQLQSLLDQGRLQGEAAVIVRGERKVFDIIREASQGAAMVFIGMRAPGEAEDAEAYAAYYAHLLEETAGFPSLAIVLTAEELDFRQLFDW